MNQMENKYSNTDGDCVPKEQPILEDFINKIVSLRNHANNINNLINENNEEIKETLRRIVGIAEPHDFPSPVGMPTADKDPSHLTFRMRKALDELSDALDKNYALLSSQNKTIQELKQLG